MSETVKAMKDVNELLDGYRAADSNERLNLFLTWASLRGEFMVIDQETKPVEQKSRRPEKV